MSTYTPIASQTLTAAASSVTFSNIPQTYTDLVVVMVAATTHSSATFPYLRFNSDSGTNYSVTELYGTGSAAGSARDTSTSRGWIGFDVSISTTVGNNVSTINVMNYSNTTTNKTWLARSNRADSALDYQGTNAIVGLYRSTSAITSVELKNSRGGTDYNFASGSTFTLYGIANASITNTAKATGGDSVTTDGTYWYHTFRSSGTFTPTQALTADYLVVAGGGGGAGAYANNGEGGGGGAGGLRSTVTATGGGGSLESALSLTSATAYTVTVGAGGNGQTGNNPGISGNNSSISGTGITTITSTGGGFGGPPGGTGAGGTGGSGGGGGWEVGAGGAGTANQGYAGGNGAGGSGGDRSAGGGGGAGGAGSNATSSNGGAGGSGVSVSISGSSVAYAGGGGGGGPTGGTATAGGGAGATNGDGTAGTANTGGGGGGAANAGSGDRTGGNGGSGIVIIRYAV